MATAKLHSCTWSNGWQREVGMNLHRFYEIGRQFSRITNQSGRDPQPDRRRQALLGPGAIRNLAQALGRQRLLGDAGLNRVSAGQFLPFPMRKE
jgi:hypothetical protein